MLTYLKISSSGVAEYFSEYNECGHVQIYHISILCTLQATLPVWQGQLKLQQLSHFRFPDPKLPSKPGLLLAFGFLLPTDLPFPLPFPFAPFSSRLFLRFSSLFFCFIA